MAEGKPTREQRWRRRKKRKNQIWNAIWLLTGNVNCRGRSLWLWSSRLAWPTMKFSLQLVIFFFSMGYKCEYGICYSIWLAVRLITIIILNMTGARVSGAGNRLINLAVLTTKWAGWAVNVSLRSKDDKLAVGSMGISASCWSATEQIEWLRSILIQKNIKWKAAESMAWVWGYEIQQKPCISKPKTINSSMLPTSANQTEQTTIHV